MLRTLIFGILVALAVPSARGADADLSRLIETVQAVGLQGKGNREAQAAWREIARQPAAKLPELLAGFDGANALAENYLRAAVDAIAERTVAAGEKLPERELEAFALDVKRSGRGRRLAYEWLAQVDPTAPDRIIPRMLNDPSLELRRDAVARAMEAAKKQLDVGEKDAAAAAYRKTLAAAREVDQIKACAAELKKLGETPDLPAHFGFVMTWRIIGPFDNTGQAAFDKAYPPENEYKPDARYEGKTGEIGWKEYATKDEYGVVDLTKALDKHKGAVAYAAAEFFADQPREVQLRLGSINATKVWLNGEALGGRDVYHAGMEIDQYVYPCKLKPGKNVILVKILQNEQTEDWAQNWQFQLRVCDKIGTAIHSSSATSVPFNP